MTFTFPDLDSDPRTRARMIEELDLDENGSGIYRSSRLTPAGHTEWPALLRRALAEHDPEWLETQCADPAYWLDQEIRIVKGVERAFATPKDAARVHAEGQFVEYYLRGLARRAVEEGAALRVVRLKAVLHPRPESEELIGQMIDPSHAIRVLRAREDAAAIGLLRYGSGLGFLLIATS